MPRKPAKRSAPKRPVRRSAAKKAIIEPDRIKIDFVILADFAQAVQGKLNLVGGGWNLHNAIQYPSKLLVGIGIGILVPWSETNRTHTVKFGIRKSEGASVIGGSVDFIVGREATIPAGMTQRATLGISAPVEIPQPGTYEVIVTCADAEKQISFEALPLKTR